MRKIERLRVRSRTKRCVKNSSEFAVTVTRAGKTYHRRAIDEGDVTALVEGHRRIIEGGAGTILKRGKGTAVTVAEAGGNRFCVKEYRAGGLTDRLRRAFGLSRGMRAWFSSRFLDVAGIPVPRALALFAPAGGVAGSEYLVTEYLEGARSLKEVAEEDFAEREGTASNPGELDFRGRRHLIRELARFIACIHCASVYHNDLSAKNIIVRAGADGGREFYFADMESVRRVGRLGVRRIVKNLGQLNDVPPCVSRAERWFFLREYLDRMRPRLSGVERKRIAREIAGFTRRRVERRMRMFGRAYPS